MANETVTISVGEYERLRKVDAHMDALDSLGVDNWGGYIGSTNYCDECGESNLSWALETCPKCGGKLDEPIDLI